jgi:hypothetical protein
MLKGLNFIVPQPLPHCYYIDIILCLFSFVYKYCLFFTFIFYRCPFSYCVVFRWRTIEKFNPNELQFNKDTCHIFVTRQKLLTPCNLRRLSHISTHRLLQDLPPSAFILLANKFLQSMFILNSQCSLQCISRCYSIRSNRV